MFNVITTSIQPKQYILDKLYNTLRPLIGVVCFLIGIIVSFTPLPLGMFFMLTGVIMLSPEVKLFRSMLKWIEEKDPTKNQLAGRLITLLEAKLVPASISSNHE